MLVDHWAADCFYPSMERFVSKVRTMLAAPSA
jgi:hypothetical protein